MAGRACSTCQGQGQIGRVTKNKTIVLEPCNTCSGSGLLSKPNPTFVTVSSQTWDADVAIVGCGIGGAALALALQQRGISYKVFERDIDFSQRKQGYGLTMQQGAIALARLGIPVAGTSSLAHFSFLPDGSVLGCYGRELDERAIEASSPDSAILQKSHKTRHNIQIPRQRLRALLVHRINEKFIEWGKKFVEYQEYDDFVELKFTNREPFRVGILVGADGIFSPIRAQRFPDPQYSLQYLGVIVILGITNTKIPSLNRRVTQTLDGETRIFTMPFTSSTDPPEDVDIFIQKAAYFDQERFAPQTDVIMWQLSFKCSQEFATSLGKQGGFALKEEALRRCKNWHNIIPELLNGTEPQDITGYPAFDRDIVKDYTLGVGGINTKTTMIGDAAHCMSPFKGQGANQALVDAICLARQISTVLGPYKTPGTSGIVEIPSVLRKFEAEMMQRAGEKVEMSREAARFLHSQDALVIGNCVRSAASFERKKKIKTELVDNIDEQRRESARKIFQM